MTTKSCYSPDTGTQRSNDIDNKITPRKGI